MIALLTETWQKCSFQSYDDRKREQGAGEWKKGRKEGRQSGRQEQNI